MIISYKYWAYPDAVTEAELNAARIAPIPAPRNNKYQTGSQLMRPAGNGTSLFWHGITGCIICKIGGDHLDVGLILINSGNEPIGVAMDHCCIR